jgi:exonuclease VII small subunit
MRKIKTIISCVKKEQKRIAKNRDKLRDLISELESMADELECANEAIEDGIRYLISAADDLSTRV